MPKKPSKRQIAAAKRLVRENQSLIVLHALYQRLGLPTALLKPLLKPHP